MYLLTERRWYRNTLLQMTLVRSDKSENEAGHSIRLTARVVRSGRDGVGFAFVFPASSRPLDGVFESDATQASLKKFLAGVECEAASWSMSAVLLLLLISLAFCTGYRVVLIASLVAGRG
jgi:hypothetical protein